MKVTPTKLRQDIFRILDNVIATGEPVEVHRNGQVLKIVLSEKRSKLANLKQRSYSDEPLSAFDHIDWSTEWKCDE